MAERGKEQSLVQSVLDRLLDDNPGSERDPPLSTRQLMRDLKQYVRRDLENLLNTRWRCVSWPPDLEQLESSVVNYGIPDFTGTNMSLRSEREQLRAIVEKSIRRFEPRFKSVRVALLENADDFDRTVRFRIDALLRTNQRPNRLFLIRC